MQMAIFGIHAKQMIFLGMRTLGWRKECIRRRHNERRMTFGILLTAMVQKSTFGQPVELLEIEFKVIRIDPGCDA